MPLDVVDLDVPVVTALYQNSLVLVRPDGHVAWRADTEPADARALIDVVRGAKAWANLEQREDAADKSVAAAQTTA